MADSPHLLVVGGPNGSGKTTLALEYASEVGFRYIGADAIAAEIDPGQPSRAQVAAARRFIQQLTIASPPASPLLSNPHCRD